MERLLGEDSEWFGKDEDQDQAPSSTSSSPSLHGTTQEESNVRKGNSVEDCRWWPWGKDCKKEKLKLPPPVPEEEDCLVTLYLLILE